MDIDVNRLVEIIREENPMVYELALRRAVIEQQRREIELLTLQSEGVS